MERSWSWPTFPRKIAIFAIGFAMLSKMQLCMLTAIAEEFDIFFYSPLEGRNWTCQSQQGSFISTVNSECVGLAVDRPSPASSPPNSPLVSSYHEEPMDEERTS